MAAKYYSAFPSTVIFMYASLQKCLSKICAYLSIRFQKKRYCQSENEQHLLFHAIRNTSGAVPCSFSNYSIQHLVSLITPKCNMNCSVTGWLQGELGRRGKENFLCFEQCLNGSVTYQQIDSGRERTNKTPVNEERLMATEISERFFWRACLKITALSF